MVKPTKCRGGRDHGSEEIPSDGCERHHRRLHGRAVAGARTCGADLSQEGFLDKVAEATNDLDIGLVVSNAGTGNPGEFLKLDRQLLQKTLRLSTMAHLDIAHHFGAKLAASVKRTMTAKMLGKTLANKPAPANARAEA
jgi:short-subunit dehydrogenase